MGIVCPHSAELTSHTILETHIALFKVAFVANTVDVRIVFTCSEKMAF